MCVLSSSVIVDIPPVTSVDCIVGLTHQSRSHLKFDCQFLFQFISLSKFYFIFKSIYVNFRMFSPISMYVTSSQWSGERSGVIKYLGETKFGKGAWAGVALDGFYHLPRLDDHRVYDGSVDGTRYFQCPPKMCVFSRLSELTTMHPLKDGIQYQPAALQWTSITAEPTKRLQLFKLNITILFHSVEPIGPNSRVIEVGSRVMVTSSRGSAAGTLLRYLSSTNDRAFIWAGVKLDNPLGLDDGTMAGPLHIDCPPIFQVLASFDKISHEHLGNKKVYTYVTILILK